MMPTAGIKTAVGGWCATAAATSPTAAAAAAAAARRIAVRSVAAPPKKMDLRVRQLGDSDLMVPEICLGTMTWGQQNTEKEAHEQLSYALDCGVNFLDTAEMYPVPTKAETQGSTDRYIGSWLKDRPRDQIILATKVAGYSERINWLRSDGRAARVDAKSIKESVESSLQRLGTDYIDLLQIHWPDRYVPLFGQSGYDVAQQREAVSFAEQLQALAEVQKSGKVRYFGVSNETSYGVMAFEMARKELKSQGGGDVPKMVSIQNSYSLIVRSAFETDLAETCSPAYCNLGLLAYSPLAGGALSGKYLKSDFDAANCRFNLFPGYMSRFLQSRAQEAVAKYVQIAEKYGMSCTELALAFCRSRWFVTSSIIGATSMEQLEENIGAFGKEEISEECLEEIDKIFKVYRDPAMTS